MPVGYSILTFLIHTTRGHGAQSLDDVTLHVFMLERVPKHLPQPFNSDIQNSLTSRLKGLGYWLAAVVADVSQMLGKVNHKGPGYLANIDHVAGLTGDGLHHVVTLTREGPLDVHLTFGMSDGGVGTQVGECLAPVSGAGKCAWCGVYMAAGV